MGSGGTAAVIANGTPYPIPSRMGPSSTADPLPPTAPAPTKEAPTAPTVLATPAKEDAALKRRPASELWLVHGKFHDLRPFYKDHPGGEFVLAQCMGSDCTALVYSHHLSDTPFRTLAKHECLPSADEPTMRCEYGRDTTIDYSFDPSGFYLTLRRRVREHFKERGIRHPNQAGFYTLLNLAVSSLVWCATWAHMCVYPFWWPVALLNGFLRLRLTGIGHDAIHHNVTPQWPIMNDLLFQVFGAFSAMASSRWHYEHVVLHHPHTKTDADPDEELPLLRLSARAPWAHVHYAQVVSQILLGIFLSYANAILEFAIFVVENCFLNERQRVREGKPSRTKPLNALFSLVVLQCLPMLTNESYADAWRSSLFSCGFYGIILLHTFHVSHIVEETSSKPFKKGMDWGENQINTSANVKTWFEMGTLDLQIEHHLFPNLSYDNQISIIPVVKQAAKEFGLQYFEHQSLYAAYAAHIDWMNKLGIEQRTDPALPFGPGGGKEEVKAKAE